VGALDDFLDAHRLRPWVCFPTDTTLGLCTDRTDGLGAGDGAPAAAMHRAYQAYMAAQDPELKVLGQPEFGAGLKARPWTGWDRPDSIYYRALTVQSREERAVADARRRLLLTARAAEYRRIMAEGLARHVAACRRIGCDHEPTPVAVDKMHAQADAAVESVPVDPTTQAAIDQLAEERYGPYLRWRPGQPEPAAPEGGHHHPQWPEERDGFDQVGGDPDRVDW